MPTSDSMPGSFKKNIFMFSDSKRGRRRDGKMDTAELSFLTKASDPAYSRLDIPKKIIARGG